MKKAIFTFENKFLAAKVGLVANGNFGKNIIYNFDNCYGDKAVLKSQFNSLQQVLTGLKQPFSASFATETKTGYKFFTPKSQKFLSKIVLKMGFGGAEMGFRLSPQLRARAKRIKLFFVGIDKAMVGSTRAEIRSLKWPGAYTGKGLTYANEKFNLKKRKQQQRSK